MAAIDDFDEMNEAEEDLQEEEEAVDVDDLVEEDLDATGQPSEKKQIQELLYRGFSGKLREDAHKLLQAHPEIQADYMEIVREKLPVKDLPVRNDSNHKTYPFLTQYEKTKVLSLRASQLAHNSLPFIEVPKHITDVHEIAKLELEAKRIPFIIKRPIPDRTFEYWRLQDLIIL
jgi:DNA-directed RNA polymerase I, II, and III subunit RPABC2